MNEAIYDNGTMIEIKGKEFKTVEELAYCDELFWNDLDLRQSSENLMFYIQDNNQGQFYEIENKFAYCSDLQILLDRNENIKFHLITDKEILSDLEKEFN